MLGLSGRVCGQWDTLMLNRFANQDPYKLKVNLDSNQDIDNYLNNRHYSNTSQSRPTNFGFGTGIYYQWGLYDGNISNYISAHRAFYIPFVSYDFFVKKFVFQMLGGFGRITVNGININGDIFKGTFCGTYSNLIIAMGYEAYSNSKFSFIPNIGFQVHNYSVYAGADRAVIGYCNPMTEFTITYYSFGLITDYKILKMNKLNKKEIGYVSIRLKYDYCLPTWEEEYFSGNAHLLTIGLTTIFRNKKTK